MAIKFGNNRDNTTDSAATPVPSAASKQPVPQISAGSSNFIRYVGYNDQKSFERTLIDLYAKTKSDGVFIDKTIPNPSNPEVSKLSSIADVSQELNEASITGILQKLQLSRLLELNKIGSGKTPAQVSSIICGILDDIRSTASSANAVKNIFLKFLCWFIRYSTYRLTNILYIGEISKSEIYWLYILSKMGCTVTYVNYTSDSNYLSVDPSSKYSSLVQGSIFVPLNIEFGKINIAALTQAAKVNEIISRPAQTMIKYLQTTHETMEKELLTTFEERKTRLLCTDTTIPIYFMAYIGFDDEILYKNMLFTIKDEFPKKNKPLIFLQELKKPTYTEASDYYSIQKTNDMTMINLFAAKISIKDRNDRTLLAQKAFIDAINSFNTNNLYNTAVQLLVWIKKFTSGVDFFNSDLPAIMYYGLAGPIEITFLNIMSQIGIDVLYFSPNKSVINILNSSDIKNLQIIERPNSAVAMPFPDKFIKTKMATTAYNAERSLDNILYNDTTMFRDYQFRMSQNQTLKTTYEELGLMWHQEAMFRTGFDKKDNYVIIPNLFAKINGINKGDVPAYYKEIALRLSPHSVYYSKIPFYKPIMSNDNYTSFYSGMKIDIEKLRRSKFNKYDYMNDDIQSLIFHKMQEVIDSGFIDVPPGDIVPLVIKTGLNIPNALLQMLQSFDFTKDIPKIVIVSSSKQTFAVFECILLVLFNLIGFDIIVYTPTGYKNLDSFIRPEAFEVFVMSEFKYDFSPQSLRIPKEIPQEKDSFLGRLFKGKGK